MILSQEARGFIEYLRTDRPVRSQIKADRDRTLLYAGAFFGPEFAQLQKKRQENSNLAKLQMLGDVLDRLPPPPGITCPSMKFYVEHLIQRVPERPDGFAVWSSLSKIFASNAEGRVYFSVGSGVQKSTKVLAAVEVKALRRNPRIDAVSREMAYYILDLINAGRTDINVGFTPAPP